MFDPFPCLRFAAFRGLHGRGRGGRAGTPPQPVQERPGVRASHYLGESTVSPRSSSRSTASRAGPRICDPPKPTFGDLLQTAAHDSGRGGRRRWQGAPLKVDRPRFLRSFPKPDDWAEGTRAQLTSDDSRAPGAWAACHVAPRKHPPEETIFAVDRLVQATNQDSLPKWKGFMKCMAEARLIKQVDATGQDHDGEHRPEPYPQDVERHGGARS